MRDVAQETARGVKGQWWGALAVVAILVAAALWLTIRFRDDSGRASQEPALNSVILFKKDRAASVSGKDDVKVGNMPMSLKYDAGNKNH